VPLFSFVQAEFPWTLGPPDGRYLLRDGHGEPEHVVVLGTLGAARRRRRVARRRPTTPEPAAVPTARATVIDAEPLADEGAAAAWLSRADPETTASAAVVVVNRLLFAHRIASADPRVNEVSPAQALVVRAGFGDGDDVADGRWREARELVLAEPRLRRTAALRPQERVPQMIAGRERALVGEELTLRARLDLDADRLAHAAAQLAAAYAVALPELELEGRPDLAARMDELRALEPAVQHAARPGGDVDREALVNALQRLEAAWRARTALQSWT